LDLDPSRVGIVELDEMGEEGAAIQVRDCFHLSFISYTPLTMLISCSMVSQDYLEKETGQRTVPSVWLKHKFIGGSSDLAAKSEEDIIEMLK
jgi:hypothetical protein